MLSPQKIKSFIHGDREQNLRTSEPQNLLYERNEFSLSK